MNWQKFKQKEIKKVCKDCEIDNNCVYIHSIDFCHVRPCKHKRIPKEPKKKQKKWSGPSRRMKGAYEKF